MAITEVSPTLFKKGDFPFSGDVNLESSLDACRRIYKLRFGRESYQCEKLTPSRYDIPRNGRKDHISWKSHSIQGDVLPKLERSVETSKEFPVSVASGYFVEELKDKSRAVSRNSTRARQEKISEEFDVDVSVYAPTENLREKWKEKHPSFIKKFIARQKGRDCFRLSQEHSKNREKIAHTNLPIRSPPVRSKTWIRGNEKHREKTNVPAEKTRQNKSYHFRQITRSNSKRPLVDLQHDSVEATYLTLPAMQCHAIKISDRFEGMVRSVSVGGKFKDYNTKEERVSVKEGRQRSCSTSYGQRLALPQMTIRSSSLGDLDRKSSNILKLTKSSECISSDIKQNCTWCESYSEGGNEQYVHNVEKKHKTIKIIVPSVTLSEI